MVAAAAAHHATLLFGSLLFALPVLALALVDAHHTRMSIAGFMARTAAVALLVGAAIAVVLLPFWIALYHYPVTQTPIPHPSRANFLLSPQWGLNYFVIPYGALLLTIPFILWRGSAVVRLRPLLFGFWLAFLFGLGGTTPVGRVLLGRAFEVLTFERFTYWATLLAMPFVGLLISELVDRFGMRAVIGVTAAASLSCALVVAWAVYRPADTSDFEVSPIAAWLNRDGHDKYRYITLGFGNKISRLAMLTDAGSVDGEWNSGRMLPELTQYGGGALTSAKYFGQSGLDSLSAMLRHADRYGLKWVVVRDSYYEPLLVFAGWRKVDDLQDSKISIWSKDGVPPATPLNSPQIPPPWQGLMWGILPMGSSILAMLLLLIPQKQPGEGRVLEPSLVDARDKELVFGRAFQ